MAQSAQRTANLIAAVTIVGIIACVAVTVEASRQSGNASGPNAVTADAGGTVYFTAGQYLFSSDRNGAVLERVPLKDLGIEGPVGDIQPINAGVLLVDGGAGDLKLCRLGTRSCKSLAPLKTGPVMKSAVRLDTDRAQGRIFAVSTMERRIDVYGSDGQYLHRVQPMTSFRFPNEVVATDGGALVVADTDNHRIVAIDGNAPEEAKTLWEFSTSSDLGRAGRRLPIAVQRAPDGNWWVVNTNFTYSNGDVMVYSPEGKPKFRVSLPEDADPTSMAAVGERMLIADFDGFRLFSASLDGRNVRPFGDGSVARELEFLKTKHEFWGAVQYGIWGVLALFVLFGGYAVYLDGKARREEQPADPVREVGKINHPEAIAHRIGADGIIWLSPAAKIQRILRVGTVIAPVFIILGCLPLFLLPGEESTRLVGMMLIPGLGIVALLFVFSRVVLKTRIGTDGSALYVADHRGRRLKLLPNQLTYSSRVIMGDTIAVRIKGGNGAEIYPLDGLVKYIYPLLGEAKRVNELAMEWRLLKAGRTEEWLSILLVAGLLAVLGLARTWLPL